MQVLDIPPATSIFLHPRLCMLFSLIWKILIEGLIDRSEIWNDAGAV
jgi:hypothetical protein